MSGNTIPAAVPGGKRRIDIEKGCFSLLGVTRGMKTELTAKIEAAGGRIQAPGAKTQYLIYSASKAKSMKFWPIARKRAQEGTICLLTPDLFYALTEDGYSLDLIGLSDRIELICLYFDHLRDRYGRMAEIEEMMEKRIRLTADALYGLPEIRYLIRYLEFLTEKEALWTETGYSDGLFVNSLLKRYSEQAVSENDLEKTAALLDYGEVHYGFPFADNDDLNLDPDRVPVPGYAVYYQKEASVMFGSFVQSDADDAQPEPIEWTVLDQKDGKALLVSRYCLDGRLYHPRREQTSWETCTLRYWLNQEFLNTAFDESERRRIKDTRCTADKNPEFDSPAGNPTTDRVFLLSISEAEQYFRSDEDRKAVPTAYAKKQGAFTINQHRTADGKACCWWWLRSTGFDGRHAADILSDGSVVCGGNHVNDGCYGVRPALWIDFTSETACPSPGHRK